MPLYQVEVTDLVYVTRTIEVEADDPQAARDTVERGEGEIVEDEIQSTHSRGKIESVCDEDGNEVELCAHHARRSQSGLTLVARNELEGHLQTLVVTQDASFLSVCTDDDELYFNEADARKLRARIDKYLRDVARFG